MPASKRARTSGGDKPSERRGGGGPAGYGYMLNKYYPSSHYFQRAVPRTAATAERYGYSRKTADPLQVGNRDLDRMTGHGKYSFGQRLRSMGKAASGYAKSLGVEGLRKQLTNKVRGMAASKIDGMGSYAGQGLVSGSGMYVDNDSSYLRRGQYHGPNYASFSSGTGQDDGSVIVSNQEFYQYMYAPNKVGDEIPFTSFSIDVQPGTMSPLLAQMAGNFERYELTQCMFHFETSLDGSALQSTTGQVGDIMMVSHMDVTQADYSNASEFEHNASHVISSRVTQGLTCGVECDGRQMDGLTNGGVNFIRTSSVDTNEKDKFDQARVQIALNNLNPALEGRCIGRLYVSYTCKLIKQRLHSAVGRSIDSDDFVFSNPTITTKDPIAYFDYFFKQGSGTTTVPLVVKEPWSNLGCRLLNSQYATNRNSNNMSSTPDSDAERFNIDFVSNLSGLFRVSMEASYTVNGSVDNITGPDTSVPSWSGSFLKSVVPVGNVDIVGARATTTADLPNDTNLCVNNITVSAGSEITTDLGAGCSMLSAKAEFYVRLSPATAASRNQVAIHIHSSSGTLVGGEQYYNKNQITASRIRIERVNDHERLGDNTYSEVFATDPDL